MSAKYVLLFVLLVTATVVGTSLVQAYFTYRDKKADLIRGQSAKADSLATQVEQYLTAASDQLQRVGGVGLSRLPKPTFAKVLQAIVSPSTPLTFYIDGRGREFVVLRDSPVPTRQPGNRARDPIFRLPRSGTNYYGPFSAHGTIPIAVPETGGQGVVGEDLGLGPILDTIRNTSVGRHGYAYAVDAEGHRIVTGGGPRLKLPQIGEALSKSAPSHGSTTGRNPSGQSVFSAWAKVEPVGWRIFVEQPRDEAFAPLRGIVWRTVVLLAIFLAAAVAASVLLARRLVRPITRMRAAAGRIALGAYDGRIELERRDELGQLANEFNRMAASLEESYAGLERKVQERTRELQGALGELADKSRQLEEMSSHKSAFLANMSHELRTPLNAIIGFAQVLEQKLFGEINEKQEEYLGDILSSANHLLSLINDVLDLSKIEAGQIELERTTFSLREAVERGVVMLRERASKHDVDLSLRTAPDVELVEADERRIRQVLFNLLSNAVKFTPPGGHVEVSTVRSNGKVHVAVSDTGPGIRREDQDRIFEEFQQTDVGAAHAEGTGLGLPLSRRLVELHGGRLWVESEVGAGSTFTFTLPLERIAD